MVFIVAEFTELGLKIQRIVSQAEAQEIYNRECAKEGLNGQ